MAMITPTVFPSGVAGICVVLFDLFQIETRKNRGKKKETNNASEAMDSQCNNVFTMFLALARYTTAHLLDPRIQLLSMLSLNNTWN